VGGVGRSSGAIEWGVGSGWRWYLVGLSIGASNSILILIGVNTFTRGLGGRALILILDCGTEIQISNPTFGSRAEFSSMTS
jgi:hypothetical protein